MINAASPPPNRDSVTRLVPGGAASLAQLTDDELLASTRRLVGKANQLLAALLLHLAEVEARGAHRTRSCASLYTYCIYELRFSEDAAARRSSAARFAKQFPALLDAVAEGELHLTGLLMIGPHLTPENHAEVLGRARFRTKKELAKLVRELHPLPVVPDLVQPLGPETLHGCRNPTWPEFVESLCPAVRELPAGARPSDWVSGRVIDRLRGRTNRDGTDESEVSEREMAEGEMAEGEMAEGALPVGPVPADLPPVASPQRYQLQFETAEEHVQLLERAQALMARGRPRVSLGELHLEAMKLLVASLEKRKFAVGVTPRPPCQNPPEAERTETERTEAERTETERTETERTETERTETERVSPIRLNDGEIGYEPRQRGAAESMKGCEGAKERDATEGYGCTENGNCSGDRDLRVDRGSGSGRGRHAGTSAPARVRSRHIPAALQREVYERDAGRCSYVDSRGGKVLRNTLPRAPSPRALWPGRTARDVESGAALCGSQPVSG